MADQLEPTEGARSIDFNLIDANGKQISLSDYHSKKNVYIFFAREFN